MVFKTVAIYTRGKQFSTINVADADDLVKQNTFDYIVGLE